MSEPLDTTPCSLPSASSTKGTFASLRGWTCGTTRSLLCRAHTAALLGEPLGERSVMIRNVAEPYDI